MKLIFFVIAVCLVSLRMYFYTSGHEKGNSASGNVEVRAPGFHQRLKWLGHFTFDSTESSIRAISPGGYLEYIKNDTHFTAQSNIKGKIDFIYNADALLSDSVKAIIATNAVKDLLAFGYEGAERMEHIYRKGGTDALMAELPKLKLDNLQHMYIDRIFSGDSLSPANSMTLIKTLQQFLTDEEKMNLLIRIPVKQLDTLAIRNAYFAAVKGMYGDHQKQQVLQRLLNDTSASADIMDNVIEVASKLNGDIEKESIFYTVADDHSLSTDQWKKLITATGGLTGEMEKARILVHIAGKMPKNEELKNLYIKTAKTLTSDIQYGQVMRAIDL